jgi:hypothetical protein
MTFIAPLPELVPQAVHQLKSSAGKRHPQFYLQDEK